VTALQTVVAARSPLESAVVSIGSITAVSLQRDPRPGHAGRTIRSFDPERRSCQSIEDAAGIADTSAPSGDRGHAGNPAVVNDPQVAELARRAAARVVGASKVVSPQPTMGGEDMAVYFERVPGCFVFVGSANPERGLAEPHHSPRFDFDEEALAIGCAFLVEAAVEALSTG
jgi:amidohydrolase